MISIKFDEPINKICKVRDLSHRDIFIHENFPGQVFASVWWDCEHFIWDLFSMKCIKLVSSDEVTLVDLDITVRQ